MVKIIKEIITIRMRDTNVNNVISIVVLGKNALFIVAIQVLELWKNKTRKFEKFRENAVKVSSKLKKYGGFKILKK